MPSPPTPPPSYIPQRSALPSSQSRSRLRAYLGFTEDSKAHSSGLAGDQRAASSMRFPSSAGHAPGASASLRSAFRVLNKDGLHESGQPVPHSAAHSTSPSLATIASSSRLIIEHRKDDGTQYTLTR
ncbi:hypothetical protein HETIRDRAFT_101536 [Heterobasidion irregulare TC 32-1]|uniref:Uncharacterized protein n=1 Tax=Heterobasidion irregulare (strain TC 32-1) TaxID=747525 RepID=W4K3G3_HETIT|nr:uncharacterized protein HETIRDRAFT_101536 [Heterobasidion irregulare TC 32-1]ETW80373.1 hypothetical protein HETIRDRAFT_101536 [Heterobasidion irregulare TC 32-1]